MNLRTAAGALSRFAHLAGRTSSSKASDDEKEDEKKAADDEKDEKAADDEGEDERDEKASDDEKDEKKAAEDEEEDGDEKEDKPSAAAGSAAARLSERRRCAAIFAAPEAAANIPLCAHLAFETDLPVKAAIGALKAGAAGGAPRRGLADRMAGERAPRLGADAGTGTASRDTPQGNADFILNAGRSPRSK